MKLISYLLLTPILASVLSQILKLIFNITLNKRKFKLTSLTDDGNYPSSHTAFVTSITAVSWFNTIVKFVQLENTEIWIWSSISLTMLWLIVVRDALGVRYTVQKLCECVTEMVENTSKAEDIKEKLNVKSGHRPYEVIAGAILGLIVASGTSFVYYGWNIGLVYAILIFGVYICISTILLKLKRAKELKPQ